MSRQAEASMLVLPVSEKRDHIFGPPNAAVTLVEYGDFECPHCGAAHLVLKELIEQLGDHFRLVFRHFPLAQIHPRAELAAEAAEAAGAQGHFWEMHDALFENQDALEEGDLVGYAEKLGLKVPRFIRELAEHTYLNRVREDFGSGVRSGVNGTPTFFLDGRRHDGGWDLESLAAAITAEAEIHSQGAKPARRLARP